MDLEFLQEDFFFNPFSSDVISPNCNGFHYTFQEQNLLKLIVLILNKTGITWHIMMHQVLYIVQLPVAVVEEAPFNWDDLYIRNILGIHQTHYSVHMLQSIP